MATNVEAKNAARARNAQIREQARQERLQESQSNNSIKSDFPGSDLFRLILLLGGVGLVIWGVSAVVQ